MNLSLKFDPIFEEKTVLIKKDGKIICNFIAPIPNLEAENISQNTRIEDFECDDIQITIYSSINELYIEGWSEESEFEIELSDKTTSVQLQKGPAFSVYAPYLNYTRDNRYILAKIIQKANKDILPIINFSKDTSFNDYLKHQKEFDYRHLIDLSAMHYDENKDSEEKDKKWKQYSFKETIQNYLDVEDVQLITPIIRITTKEPISLQLAKILTKIFKKFESIALRIEDYTNITNIETFLAPFAAELEKVFIIYESENKNIEEDRKNLFYLENISEDADLIFLSENARIDSIKALTKPKGVKVINEALESYYFHQELIPSLIYGDYMGYDKDTIVEPKIRTNASRVQLLEIGTAQYLFAKRVTGGTWGEAMRILLDLLQAGGFESFINEEHCEACDEILHKKEKIFSLGKLKTLCLLHNGIVTATL